MIDSDGSSSDTTTKSTTPATRADVTTNAAMGIDYSVDSAIRYDSSKEAQGDGNGEEAGIQRIGHVSGIWPITRRGGGELVRHVYQIASAFMGLEHFNGRNGVIIPELPHLLRECNFQMTMDIRDDQYSQRKAVEALMNATASTASSLPPFAVLGSLTSGVSSTLSILADALQIVEISGTSTSPTLDKSRHFTRTIPTNEGESAAIMNYFRQTGITSRVGILYVQDAFGEGFSKALFKQAILNNITVVTSMPYQENHESVNTSLSLLKSSEVRYIIFVSSPQYWMPVVRQAYQHGIMGPQSGRQWYGAESRSELQNDFSLDRSTETDIAEALHGMGFIHFSFSESKAFEREFQKFLSGKEEEEEEEDVAELMGQALDSYPTINSTMLDRFISSNLEPHLYDNAQLTPPKPTPYSYFMYDAIMALGIAACRTPGLFTTEEFLSQLLQSEFPGVSGHVALDRESGSRQVKDIEYEIVNFLLSPTLSTNTSHRFTFTTTTLVQGTNITQLQDPFVYADNTTIAPPDLPPIFHDYNLIPLWALAIGWVLCGMVLLTSAGFAAWTIINRQHHVVRVSQPVFLCQLCLGTFIMASLVIPLSMQEREDSHNNLSSKWNLDAACMAVPWLKWIGLATALSAILAKTIRLNKLMKKSRGMKRVSVHPTDVLQPLIVMTTCNIVLLLSCTLVAPFTWHRIPVEINVDPYGRSVESFGTCQHYTSSTQDTDPRTYYFMAPLRIFNCVGLGVAAWHCYNARDLPTEMSESRYLFVTTISMVETHLIIVPMFFLSSVSPTALYILTSTMTSIVCFSILLPIFLPKYKLHKTYVSRRGRNNLVDMSVIGKRNRTRVTSGTEDLGQSKRTEWGRMSVVRNSAKGRTG